MRKLAAIAVLAVAATSFVAVADGAMVRVGTLVLRADGGFTPRVLPKRAYAPIEFKGYGRITTTNGTPPPALQHVKLDFDRDGRLTTAGLGVCPPQRIEGTSPERARRLCRGAIVGTGTLGAVVSLPGLQEVNLSSPLTLFNGPRQGGDQVVVGHTQATFPQLETYVVAVPIERRGGSTYGYRASFDVPALAGGYGALTNMNVEIGRRYDFHGSERSYVSARCSDGIMQTQGYFSFADGNVIYGSVFKACRASD